ncbi:glutamate--tRNA ligase [Candidatus Oleimmundimicrobium sp.]|uniref:glutamate--tRNA ligase n=1 Tax=Candidatus Oleimmundimicrobium sp. TaxID=3060597 RepID=UPI002720BABD|nr:glutamate--tRNA ligase [Candidatus Oleimmundimicrobium sp.]MDO8885977.1 glutamate--tRNA ligase [Candidatus Oleimmundimicrobium sp.]
MKDIRVRFAPSPTGHLHIGTSRTVLFNWLFARSQNGVFILRIEDTDRSRSTVEYERSIIEDISWLGLNWDEGPEVGGKYGPYYQSQRGELYKKAADELLKKGLAYRCYCTEIELEERREEAIKQGVMPKYDGQCRNLTSEDEKSLISEGRKPTIRFRVPKRKIVVHDLVKGDVEFDSNIIGDFILIRSDGMASFNFAVVVDDAAMKITHVIRGEDHLANTARHILLFEALGYPIPKFAHNSMTLGPDHAKLSKRHGATSIGEYRRQGFLSSALVNCLALLGWSLGDGREIFTLQELVQVFSIDRISKSPAIFDIEKFKWINGQHIRKLSIKELTYLVLPYLEEAGYINAKPTAKKVAWIEKVVEAVQTNLVVLSDIKESSKLFFEDKPEYSKDALEVLKEEQVPKVFEVLKKVLAKANEIDIEKAKIILKEVAGELKSHGIKGKGVYHPIRVALTGALSGPELFYVISVFGKEKCLERIEEAIKLV